MDKLSDKSFYITKAEHNSDVKSIELGFNDGISVFVPKECIMNYSCRISKLVDVIDDPLFKTAFKVDRGSIYIDSTCLNDIVSEYCVDDLTLNNIKIEFDNNYPIHSDIPFMLLITQQDDVSVVLEDGIFKIIWN